MLSTKRTHIRIQIGSEFIDSLVVTDLTGNVKLISYGLSTQTAVSEFYTV